MHIYMLFNKSKIYIVLKNTPACFDKMIIPREANIVLW